MKSGTWRVRAAGLGGTAILGLLALGCGAREGAEVEGRELPLAAERLASELELDAGQRGRLEAVHAMVEERLEAHRAERDAHFGRVRAAVETGEVDAEEVHGRIDERLDEVRGLAHRAADELIGLVRGLRPEQRERALERLDRAHERMDEAHERAEAEGGPRALLARHLRGGCGGPLAWPCE